jgi:CBS domain-containing protein
MRAHQIMTQHVISIGADASIVEAAQMMLRYHISGLPVVDASGKLVGIVSEGDFIRRAEIGTETRRDRWLRFLVGTGRIAADFVRSHGRKVGEIMTPNPLTVTEDAPLDRIARIMETGNVKRLPVMRGDRLVGIVTRSDFLATVADLASTAQGPSADDERIQNEVAAAIAPAAWRPWRLKVAARNGIVSLDGVVENKNARLATIVAAENVAGVKQVVDNLCDSRPCPPPEEDLGGGDIASLQEQPSTTDDEPL